jgi:hypothetical protein
MAIALAGAIIACASPRSCAGSVCRTVVVQSENYKDLAFRWTWGKDIDRSEFAPADKVTLAHAPFRGQGSWLAT